MSYGRVDPDLPSSAGRGNIQGVRATKGAPATSCLFIYRGHGGGGRWFGDRQKKGVKLVSRLAFPDPRLAGTNRVYCVNVTNLID